MSQLDLALSADVSSRHVSFLETGRASPSREMVLRLGATLGVPLREQNAMLVAAGFAEEFSEAEGLPPAIERALSRMLAQQEPYPMVVMNRLYRVLRLNGAAEKLLARFVAEPAALAPPVNVLDMVLDPRLCRPFIQDWEHVARDVLGRLHRESLANPADADLSALLESAFRHPDVPESLRHPDFSRPSEATLAFRVRRGDLAMGFLTTLTVFSAPQNVTLDELRIESYFPLDEATERECQRQG